MKILLPNFEKRGGLITVVAQDAITKKVLMVAFTDLSGYLETLRTGKAVYYSTSRKERWMKGETSGGFQEVTGISIDCDGDAVIYYIHQHGSGTCHTKAQTCFYRDFQGNLLMEAPGAGKGQELMSTEAEVSPTIIPMV